MGVISARRRPLAAVLGRCWSASITEFAAEPPDGPPIDIEFSAPRADDPAYVMFTSGTTGMPKQVIGPHGALSHFLDWQRGEFSIGADRCAQLTGLSFAVVFRDMFLALVSGAPLVIPDENDRLTPGLLLDWFRRERISVVHTVPSVARTWLAEAESAGLSGGFALRWLFSAGEPLDDELVRRWRSVFPGQVINMYGPSETVLAKLRYHVTDPPRPGIQPLGKPLPHTQVLIVADDGQRLCGIGEPGEIAIRTPFRSQAVLARVGERGTRFVRSRWTANPEPDDLVCLTGDRGRWAADGSVEYLGRLDDQVKVRGVRVSPEEVSREIRRLPGVRDAAVLPVTHADSVSLAAYVVAQIPGGLAVVDVRAGLRSVLAAAMVPDQVRIRDALPITRNGKVDRKALRELPPVDTGASRVISTGDVAGDELQRQLARIWCDVLEIEAVGVHDNFFDVGGHSLSLVEVHRRIRDQLGGRVQIVDLFRDPTIAALAKALNTVNEPRSEQRLEAARHRGARRRQARGSTVVRGGSA